jgi:hypothetical protein
LNSTTHETSSEFENTVIINEGYSSVQRNLHLAVTKKKGNQTTETSGEYLGVHQLLKLTIVAGQELPRDSVEMEESRPWTYEEQLYETYSAVKKTMSIVGRKVCSIRLNTL